MKVKKTYKAELKRQMRMAIAAAIGFMIAYSWRETIFGFSKEVMTSISTTLNASLINLYSSVFITLLGVLFIIISSRMLRDKK